MINKHAILVLVSAMAAAVATGCGDPAAAAVTAAEGQPLGLGTDQEAMQHCESGHGTHTSASTPYATRDPKALALRERRIKEVYENLVFPTPVAILGGTKSVEHIFEKESVKGRVTPLGQFPDFGAVVEYFYALAITPGSRVDGVKFRSLFAGNDKVAVAVDIHFCRSADGVCDPEVANSEVAQTLSQVGFFQFNRENRVISIDLNILNLGKASDPPNDPTVHAGAISQLCTALTVAHIEPTTGAVVYQGTCTSYFDGAEDFVSGFPLGGSAFENCVSFMHSIPYGSWDRANSNTVTCRQLHTILTAVDPEMHCPHTSSEGGGACIDFTYASYYTEAF